MGKIVNGIYIKNGIPSAAKSSSQFKSWHHKDQRDSHRAEITQSFIHGKPNPEFIRLYPEESKGQFTPAEIQHYGNQY